MSNINLKSLSWKQPTPCRYMHSSPAGCTYFAQGPSSSLPSLAISLSRCLHFLRRMQPCARQAITSDSTVVFDPLPHVCLRLVCIQSCVCMHAHVCVCVYGMVSLIR
eukprot:scpid6616/ scgid8379/ 